VIVNASECRSGFGIRWCFLAAIILGIAGSSLVHALQAIESATARAPVEDEQDIERLRHAAEQGRADAQNALGVMYDDGRGVAQDPAQAREWFRKAAEQGHAAAQNNLAFMYEVGRGGPLDYGAALKWYRLAAEGGWPAAQASLGLMYAGAVGVIRDLVEAYKWIDIAATGASDEEQKKYVEVRDVLARKMTPNEMVEARRRSQEWRRALARRQR
jgi:hypothetical protein